MNSFCSFSSLPSSIANSPILSPHGSPQILSTRFPSNGIVFRWCVLMGSLCSPGFGSLSLIILTFPRVDSVSRDDVSADVSMLPFPDPANFISNQLHCHLQEWKSMAASSCSYVSQDVLGWLANKVQVQLFFRHLRKILRGNILTRPPHLSGSFTITGRVLPLPSSSLTRFCNASLPVLFRFGVTWAR